MTEDMSDEDDEEPRMGPESIRLAAIDVVSRLPTRRLDDSLLILEQARLLLTDFVGKGEG